MSKRPGCPGTWMSWDLSVRGPGCPGPECPGPVCPGPECLWVMPETCVIITRQCRIKQVNFIRARRAIEKTLLKTHGEHSFNFNVCFLKHQQIMCSLDLKVLSPENIYLLSSWDEYFSHASHGQQTKMPKF